MNAAMPGGSPASLFPAKPVSATEPSSVGAAARPEHGTSKRGANANGAPLLGDSRDLFRPKTSDIPAEPGVYKWRDAEGRVIYVGKAKNLRNRLTFYFQPLSMLHPRTQAMVLAARGLEWTVVGTELEALTLEYTWIKEFDPRFNVVFKDDKTYPFLAVSFGEEIPRTWITRSRKTRKTRYFGPYAKVAALKKSLDGLLPLLPVRTCAPGVFHRAQRLGRPCLLASIGRCSAPCIGAISPTEHRNMVSELAGILTGRLGTRYIHALTEQMKQASADLDFEKAAALRDKIAAMRNVVEENAVVFADDVDADIFGYAGDSLEAAVHAFFVRSGTIRGERNWSLEKVEDVSDQQLMADMIVQIYSQLLDTTDQNGFHVTSPAGPSSTRIALTTQRDAIAASQSPTATTAATRAKATRDHRNREQQTGRVDLFSETAPIPPEILVPVEPENKRQLEKWLTNIRGSAVTIRAAQRGDKKQLLDRATQNAQLALGHAKKQRTSSLEARTRALNGLADQLGLDKPPLRIEGYDISNASGGGYQTASMIVFEDGAMRKDEYRRFSIATNTQPHSHNKIDQQTDSDDERNTSLDDLSALYQTLVRRFTHHDENADAFAASGRSRKFAYKPDLVVVDGGQAQANVAAKALRDCGVDGVGVCGLAKRLEEVWLPGEDYPLILKRQSDAMYLLQRIRDESHRFAISYHRSRRARGTVRSIVESIPGIGPAYAKRLRDTFGSYRNLRNAAIEDIAAVDGIGRKRAAAVYAALHQNKTGRNDGPRRSGGEQDQAVPSA